MRLTDTGRGLPARLGGGFVVLVLALGLLESRSFSGAFEEPSDAELISKVRKATR
jgi:hypothetical protein